MSRNPFQNTVAIVTGGASGIGRALCEALGRHGATVVVADVDESGAKQVADAIPGGRAQAATLDVTQGEAVRALVEATVREHGRLDYLFNNAGVALAAEVRDMTLEHWRRILDVHLWGVIHGTMSAYPIMLRQGFGHIVNTASIAGLLPGPVMTAYSTAKHAIVGLSLSLRCEAAELGVRVSVVCPGFVRSRIFERAAVVQPRWDEPREVFQACLNAAVPPEHMMDCTRAAEAILAGVRRNRGLIVFPFRTWLAWWLYRLWPPLLGPIAQSTLAAFRGAP